LLRRHERLDQLEFGFLFRSRFFPSIGTKSISGFTTLLCESVQDSLFSGIIHGLALIDTVSVERRLDRTKCVQGQFVFGLHGGDDSALGFL
jgi:hypothetical protein